MGTPYITERWTISPQVQAAVVDWYQLTSLHHGDVKFLRADEWLSDIISEVILNTWPEACRFR
jgi:hypothetical protein